MEKKFLECGVRGGEEGGVSRIALGPVAAFDLEARRKRDALQRGDVLLELFEAA